MPTSQTVLIDAYDYGDLVLSAKLRDPDDVSVLEDTATSVTKSGDLPSRITAVFTTLLTPTGTYLLELIVGTVSYSLYVTLTGVDGETAVARSDRETWNQVQIDYALAQLAYLTLTGNSVVVTSGTFLCGRGDIEQIFGTTAVATWADLNNNGDADEISARINYRIAMADSYVRSVLANSQWAMPVDGDTLPIILVVNTAALAGVYLYEGRGVQDYNQAGHAQHQLSYHKKNVEDFLKGVLVGSISLSPLLLSVQNSGPMAINPMDE